LPRPLEQRSVLVDPGVISVERLGEVPLGVGVAAQNGLVQPQLGRGPRRTRDLVRPVEIAKGFGIVPGSSERHALPDESLRILVRSGGAGDRDNDEQGDREAAESSRSNKSRHDTPFATRCCVRRLTIYGIRLPEFPMALAFISAGPAVTRSGAVTSAGAGHCREARVCDKIPGLR